MVYNLHSPFVLSSENIAGCLFAESWQCVLLAHSTVSLQAGLLIRHGASCHGPALDRLPGSAGISPALP